MEGVRAVVGGAEGPEMVVCHAFGGEHGGAAGDILYFLFQPARREKKG